MKRCCFFLLTNTSKSNPRTDISPEYLIGGEEENGLIHRQRLTSVDRRCSTIFCSSSSSCSLCSYLRTHDLFSEGMYTNVYRQEGEEEKKKEERRKIELKPRKMRPK